MECVVQGIIETQHVEALEILLQGLCGVHKERLRIHELCLKSAPNLEVFTKHPYNGRQVKYIRRCSEVGNPRANLFLAVGQHFSSQNHFIKFNVFYKKISRDDFSRGFCALLSMTVEDEKSRNKGITYLQRASPLFIP